MSGIVCLAGKNNQQLVAGALERLKHRGPRGQGIVSNGSLQLGYTVFTPGSGDSHQEFYRDQKGAALFDGFLYNGGGVPAARAVLELYREQGRKFLNLLDGIFALAVSEGDDFLLARDPFGLKPLYYGEHPDGLLFASELKALTPFCRQVHLFPPGNYYAPAEGFVPYFEFGRDIRQKGVRPAGPQEAAGLIRTLLNEAVARRLKGLPSRRPAVLLSGGLDSSCVAAVTAAQAGKIQTFSVGYQNSRDLRSARETAAWLGTEHYEYQYDEKEMKEVLPRVIYHLESFDASLVRGALANFLAARLARAHGAEFAFMGEGSDELFGGYHYLKQKDSWEAEQELQKITTGGHNIGFQRVDRMTAAHGIQCDMPFMDRELVRLAFSLPVEWKIKDGETEKWILRLAFENQLPKDIIWRRKDEFSVGAGSAEVMAEIAEKQISDDEFARERKPAEDFVLASKEELLYYRIFREYFPQPSALATLGRWQPV
ncbi:MAG: asparagine synthase-related protein [Bacillota bacterium]